MSRFDCECMNLHRVLKRAAKGDRIALAELYFETKIVPRKEKGLFDDDDDEGKAGEDDDGECKIEPKTGEMDDVEKKSRKRKRKE